MDGLEPNDFFLIRNETFGSLLLGGLQRLAMASEREHRGWVTLDV